MKTIISKMLTLIQTYPAMTALLINGIVTVLAALKMHVTPDQVALILGILNTVLYTYVHASVTPTNKLKTKEVEVAEKPPGYVAPMNTIEE